MKGTASKAPAVTFQRFYYEPRSLGQGPSCFIMPRIPSPPRAPTPAPAVSPEPLNETLNSSSEAAPSPIMTRAQRARKQAEQQDLIAQQQPELPVSPTPTARSQASSPEAVPPASAASVRSSPSTAPSSPVSQPSSCSTSPEMQSMDKAFTKLFAQAHSAIQQQEQAQVQRSRAHSKERISALQRAVRQAVGHPASPIHPPTPRQPSPRPASPVRQARTRRRQRPQVSVSQRPRDLSNSDSEDQLRINRFNDARDKFESPQASVSKPPSSYSRRKSSK